MIRRIESPSSINTYLQCPRKYYYSYIEKRPRKGSVATVRGKVVHSVLEKFYDIDFSNIDQVKFYDEFRFYLLDLFHRYWKLAIPEFLGFGVDRDKVLFLYTETIEMIDNFLYGFCLKLENQMRTLDFKTAFNRLKPVREKKYVSKRFNVLGFIDAINEIDGEVVLWDYKTSKRSDITSEYRLQLGLYALMYKENHGVLPDKVGVNFLRSGEQCIEVSESLIKEAKLQCELIHLNTESDSIYDYPKKPGPLCKWREGCCDFYSLCFGNKSLSDY